LSKYIIIKLIFYAAKILFLSNSKVKKENPKARKPAGNPI